MPDTPITGLCARCKRVRVPISPEAAKLARECSHALTARGEDYLKRSEVVLCEDCYVDWHAERVAVTMRESADQHEMWVTWRRTAKTTGTSTANVEAPRELFDDWGYSQLRLLWLSWWQIKQAKAGRAGEKGL